MVGWISIVTIMRCSFLMSPALWGWRKRSTKCTSTWLVHPVPLHLSFPYTGRLIFFCFFFFFFFIFLFLYFLSLIGEVWICDFFFFFFFFNVLIVNVVNPIFCTTTPSRSFRIDYSHPKIYLFSDRDDCSHPHSFYATFDNTVKITWRVRAVYFVTE